jgi:hypothetical protein
VRDGSEKRGSEQTHSSALMAGHVIASAVLLCRHMTFGTIPCRCLNHGEGFQLRLQLLSGVALTRLVWMSIGVEVTILPLAALADHLWRRFTPNSRMVTEWALTIVRILFDLFISNIFLICGERDELLDLFI